MIFREFFCPNLNNAEYTSVSFPILSGGALTFINLSWFHSINTNAAKTIQSLLLWNPKYVSLSLKVSLWSASLPILNGNSFQRSKRKYFFFPFVFACACTDERNIFLTFQRFICCMDCSFLQEVLVNRRVGGWFDTHSVKKSPGQETCGWSA